MNGQLDAAHVPAVAVLAAREAAGEPAMAPAAPAAAYARPVPVDAVLRAYAAHVARHVR